MAEATDNHTPAGDEWTVDDAFRYLTRDIGKQDDLAIYQLTESLLAGRLRMSAKRFVDGVLNSAGVVPTTFWRDHLTLEIVEGRAEVRPLKALERGDYHYTLSPRDVRHLSDVETQSSKALITAEVDRRIEAGEQWDLITKFSESLHGWMKTVSNRPLETRSIENLLRFLRLWPLPPKK